MVSIHANSYIPKKLSLRQQRLRGQQIYERANKGFNPKNPKKLSDYEQKELLRVFSIYGEFIPYEKINIHIKRLKELFDFGLLSVTKTGHLSYNYLKRDQQRQYLEAVSGKMGNAQSKRWVKSVNRENRRTGYA